MRRAFTALLTILILGGALVLFVPSIGVQFLALASFSETAMRPVRRGLEQVAYQRTLKFDGLDLLSQNELEKLLPATNSNAWWRTHSGQIEDMLKQHRMVRESSVRPCLGLSYDCFQIHIEERQPAFVAFLREEGWLVARDGSFILPLPSSSISQGTILLYGKPYRLPPVVRGVFSETFSPDVVRARVTFIADSIEAIGHLVRQRIESISFTEGGELEVRFYELDAPVVFGGDPLGNPSQVEDQARRLSVLFEELGSEIYEVRRIDLAFDSVAVVRHEAAPRVVATRKR